MWFSLGRPIALSLLLSAGIAAAPHESAPTAPLGGPEIILFHGGVLGRTVPIATWDENQVLLLVSGGPDGSSADAKFHPGARPRIDLALFRGSLWRDVARDPARLAALTPAMAQHAGVFYPADGREPALIAVGAILGTVPDSGLAMLKRHDIPTSLEAAHRAL